MSTVKIGQVDWDAADLGGGDFFKLKEGDNVVRVVTKPYQFYTVWTEDSSGQKRSFQSPVKGCPLVERGEKAKPRWYVGVLSRADQKTHILEIGPQIYKGILSLHKKKMWGDVRQYDIDIERNSPGSQPLYVVSPLPKEPLTDDEKTMIKGFLADVDFVALTEPPSRAEVLEQLGIAPESGDVDDDFGSSDSSEPDDDDFNFDV